MNPRARRISGNEKAAYFVKAELFARNETEISDRGFFPRERKLPRAQPQFPLHRKSKNIQFDRK
jgi:hypothetical protein